MSAAADDRPLEWSGIEEWWKLHLTICWRVHGAYPSTCTQPQHILIQFLKKIKKKLSVRVWHMHTLSHHSANDILSHTCSYDCTAGSVGFSMWPTRGDCTVTVMLQIPNVHILQSKLDLGLSNKYFIIRIFFFFFNEVLSVLFFSVLHNALMASQLHDDVSLAPVIKSLVLTVN